MDKVKKFAWLFAFITIGSTIAHHLVSENSFPFSSDYQFPVGSIVISILFSFTLFYTVDGIYHRFYKPGRITLQVFLVLGAGCIFTVSSLAYFIAIYAGGIDFELLNYVQGVSINLLGGALWLAVFYVLPSVRKSAVSQQQDKILITSGKQTRSLYIEQIAFFFIDNQIVYTVLKDGKRLPTSLKLGEIEDKLRGYPFFRVNRQFLISQDAVQSIKKDVNQKLLVTVEPAEQVKEPVTVSRYKYKDFQNWFSELSNGNHSDN